MGFAIPWITHPSDLAWNIYGPGARRALFRMRLNYYTHWARKADAWLMETESSATGLARRSAFQPAGSCRSQLLFRVLL